MVPRMQRSALVPVSLALVLAGLAAWGFFAWRDAEQARERAEEEAREERERDARVARQREESMALMPDVLAGVGLGMTVEEVRATGHRISPAPGREPSPSEHLTMYEERLPNGAQIMYGFGDTSGRLSQVQVMSLLPTTDAIAPHLQAMNERYGTPSAVFDCPDTQGVPTRRFVWRESQTAVSDVFLLYNGRVSLTLYVASPDTIQRSLRLGNCVPVPRERLDQFPTASPEQIQRATQEGG
jgi:hypothetical protein